MSRGCWGGKAFFSPRHGLAYSLSGRLCACRTGVGAARWLWAVCPSFNREEVVVRYFVCTACVALLIGTPPRSAAADQEVKLSAAEQKTVEVVNQARKKAKLPPVKPNALLCGSARRHAAAMAKKGDLKQSFDGKSPTEQLKAAGYDADLCGSLVAQGTDPGQVFTALLADKTCRQEILRRE